MTHGSSQGKCDKCVCDRETKKIGKAGSGVSVCLGLWACLCCLIVLFFFSEERIKEYKALIGALGIK